MYTMSYASLVRCRSWSALTLSATIRQGRGHADAHRRDALAVEPLGGHLDDPVVLRQEVDSPRVQRLELRPGIGAGLEALARRNLVGLAEEVDLELEIALGVRPGERRIVANLLEAGPLQALGQLLVVCAGPCWERQCQPEVDVPSARVRRSALCRRDRQVARNEPADEVEVLAPPASVPEDRDERALAQLRDGGVVVGGGEGHQNPNTWLRYSRACSAPRRGSRSASR